MVTRLTVHHVMQMYMGVESLSTRDGSEWSASLCGSLYTSERAPGSQWLGCLVATEPVWTLWKIETFSLWWESNPDFSVVTRR